MKLTKGQWRMLMSTVLKIVNDASGSHAYIENRLEELRQQLLAIEKRLPPEPAIDYADLRTYEIMPDGSRRECEE